MAVTVNRAGVSHARRLISTGKVNRSSPWSHTTEDKNRLLGDPPNWMAYAKWFLAVDPGASEKTKERFKYPFGKNGQVYRGGVIAAKQRASQQGAAEVAAAADRLLQLIDRKKETKSMDPLPQASYLYVGGDGTLLFPYKDATGEVDPSMLRKALSDLRRDIVLPAHVRSRLLRRASRIAVRAIRGKSLGPLEYKALDSPVEFNTDPSGIVEAYAAAFENKDEGDDILHKGATEAGIEKLFRLPERPLVRVLYGHMPDKVLGHPLDMREDDHGTWTKSQYNLETFWGNEVFHLVAAGDITEQSIGWLPGDDTPETKAVTYDDEGSRHLWRVNVHEFGPLPFAMNTEAFVVGVKSGLEHEAPFVEVVHQATNAVHDVLLEAEALAARRLGRKSGARHLSTAHIDALLELKDAAEAGIAEIERLVREQPNAEASVVEDAEKRARGLSLQLDLARARVRRAGITEV